MPIAYCTECDWTRRDDEATDDLDRAMIDHYAETGHSPIERVDREGLEDEDDVEAEAERLSGTVRIDRERASDADSDSDSESEAE